jgi:AcrR family transcriptional regulator
MSQAETKERILNAAKHVFAEKGFDGARMGAIARTAKANQALIHYYFESKEKLYEQVLLRLFGIEQNTRIINLLDNNNLIPSEQLYIEIYFLTNLHIGPKDPDCERIFLRQVDRGGLDKIISIINKYFLPQLQYMENIIKRGIQSGEFETSNAIYVIVELVLFVTHYDNFRQFVNNTEWYDHFYSEDYTKNVFEFLISNIFKALCPSGKKRTIPQIPESLIKEVDKIIDTIIKGRSGGVNE